MKEIGREEKDMKRTNRSGTELKVKGMVGNRIQYEKMENGIVGVTNYEVEMGDRQGNGVGRVKRDTRQIDTLIVGSIKIEGRRRGRGRETSDVLEKSSVRKK